MPADYNWKKELKLQTQAHDTQPNDSYTRMLEKEHSIDHNYSLLKIKTPKYNQT